jgi:muramidase (phage lysozyme)
LVRLIELEVKTMSTRLTCWAACVLLWASCTQSVEPEAEASLAGAALGTGESCDPETARGVASRVERALLDTIAFTEGTRGHGKDGYNVTFNYRYFDSCAEHPNMKICVGSLCSTAAGRYQFLHKTYVGLKLPNFWPETQELGALELVSRRGVDLPQVPMTATEFANALDKLSYEWSSLPPGRYGTPRRTLSEIRAEYCRLAGCGTQPAAASTLLAIERDGLLYRYAGPDQSGVAISSGWGSAISMGAGADYDEDGQRDFVSMDYEYGLELYVGDGQGDFWYQPIELAGSPFFAIGAGADYDEDGHADFLAVGDDDRLVLARGDGSGQFEAVALGIWAGDVAALGGGADYDGDRHADFVQVRDDGGSWIYLGDGSGRFGSEPLSLDGEPLRSIGGGADYSGDGKPDLLAITHSGEGMIYVALGGLEFEPRSLGGGWDRVRFLD